MRPYLLLTPGPLTTSETVKEAMMSDWCTWDEDYNVGIVEVIRKELVELASSRPEEYTAVLMQGSGSFCVEATLGSVIRPEDHLLVAANGAYGKRMGVIADYYHLNYHLMKFEETQQVDPAQVDAYLNEHPEVTHVSVVHCETTTGVLNPLEAIAEVVKRHGKVLIVDAMSSFGGVPIDMAKLGIDFMISSANKCIQGVPGFGFILARRSLLEQCKGIARSLSLDLYDQWETMENRYSENHRTLVEGMRSLGFKTLLKDEEQSPVITSFYYPSSDFNFKDFYQKLKTKGFVIYPGKISQADTFRIGNIGDVFPADFTRLIEAIKEIR